MQSKTASSDLGEFTLESAKEFVTAPSEDDNKYTRGVVQLSTGSSTYPGAGVLSVLGAAGAGATLIRFVSDQKVGDAVVSRVPEVVLQQGWFDAAVVGSGYAATVESQVFATAASARKMTVPVVVDAEAIQFITRLGESSGLVLTPHVGEATTLWQQFSDEPKATLRERLVGDPAGSATELARVTGATIVLKGAKTHVFNPRAGGYTVSSRAGWAGTAGSGDVLAGTIGATLARARARARASARAKQQAFGVSQHHDDTTPLSAEALLGAVAAGVFLHARAGEVASGVGTVNGQPTGSQGHPVTASQIAAALPFVVQAVLDG